MAQLSEQPSDLSVRGIGESRLPTKSRCNLVESQFDLSHHTPRRRGLLRTRTLGRGGLNHEELSTKSVHTALDVGYTGIGEVVFGVLINQATGKYKNYNVGPCIVTLWL